MWWTRSAGEFIRLGVRVVSYRSVQRMKVELAEGASVRASVVELAAEYAPAGRLSVHAAGRVDAVRLDGQGPLPGVVEVVELIGEVDAGVAQLRIVGRDAGGGLVAGTLTDARAVVLALDVEVLEPIEERAGKSARLPSKSTAAPSWAEVAAATKARQDAEAAEEAAEPEAPPASIGDLVEHPTFGTCSIEKLDDDDEFIMVRSSTQRLLRLSLDVLRLELVSDEDGKKTFRARGIRPAGKGR